MFKRIALALVALLAAAPSLVLAQSTPNFSYGQVPTAGQWNAAFGAKQDLLNFTPLNVNGGTMRGKFNTSAATTNGAGFSILPGVAPNAATNGDMWLTSAGLFAQINGQPTQFLTSSSLGTMASQNANAVAITGGTINGTTIGGTTPAPAFFTTATLSTPLALSSGGLGATSLTGALDSAFGSTQGSILYRSASAWTTLTPGTAGYVLQTGGGGANPSWVAPPTTNTPVPTRQTAISGPAASGAPTFLPSTTSGTLTLAAQNVSPSVPLIVTAAQGGLNNAITIFTSAPSWTLTASATNYLLVNASTGATIATTLAPIYQFGGTLSTTNGQFTFDWQSMTGYLGNGSTAVPTPIICLGEAVTSASAVTSTVAYAYQGRYQSAAVSFTTGTNYTFGHNVGVGPDQMETDIYSASASTGPWFPKAMSSNGSYFYPALQAPAGSASKQIIFQTGSSGVSLGFNAAATSGFLMLRVRRAW